MVTKQQVEDAQKVLGIDGTPLTREAIKIAYRALAKKHHPDAGGDAAQFAQVDRAKCILELWLDRQPKEPRDWRVEACPACDGKGRVVVRKGFAQMTITCGRCKGSGDAQWDADVVDT